MIIYLHESPTAVWPGGPISAQDVIEATIEGLCCDCGRRS
jgi:hypothetical protein